jgi:uncharacterized protein (DUF1501 family)
MIMMTAISSDRNKPTRRTLLQAGLAWAVSPAVGGALRAATGEGHPDRTLVLLQLSGGNDGLNTVIPYRDPRYHNLRPGLSRVAQQVLAINSRVGFHPSLSPIIPLFDRGHLAIVQGVGYPDPDYSHVGSCRVWATGTTGPTSQQGWWDGVLERIPMRSQAKAVCVGDGAPAVMAAACVGGGDLALSTTGNPMSYRPGQIQETLASIARVAASSRPPAMVFAAIGGFDTHTDQLEAHGEVLLRLADGLAAFQRELEWRGVADRVLLMAWSEFGRRPAENTAGGTDHGSAGPVFLLGKKIRGGLYGEMPSLKDTDFGSLIATVDFRFVYAALTKRWLGCPTGKIAGPKASLPFV